MNHDIVYDFILGTAGHIDHGKTSLIKVLTGIDTDRLPEEKQRGITIELGYAHLDLPPFRLGIVDVPGHEKFIRQMLAGATGMNLVMLVVAADDSVNQQTREHLDILQLLNLSSGVLVITKSDLVEPAWLELVEMEVRQLVNGTFLQHAPLVRTSAKSGLGIEELKRALFNECQKLIQGSAPIVPDSSSVGAPKPFRMAIDRAFSVAGHGTIVTGSVLSGSLQVGEHIEILPSTTAARVRGLQNHDSTVDSIHRGQRAAINLAGVNLQEIEHGHELASIGYLLPSELMLVKLKVLGRSSIPFKDRARVHFHIGTVEMMGSVKLLNAKEILPGQSAFAQIYLSELAVAVWNQPFVVRQSSPRETMGGGVVIHPNPCRIKNLSDTESSVLADLICDDVVKRASAATYFSNSIDWKSHELIRTAGVADHEMVFHQLKTKEELFEIQLTSSRTLVVHRLRLESISNRVLSVLERLHRKHPLRFTHPRHELAHEFDYLDPPQLLDLAIENLKVRKQICANVNSVSLVGSGPNLSRNQKQLLEDLVEQFKNSGLAAPSVSEVQSAFAKNKDTIVELLELATKNGALVKISDDLYLHVDIVARVLQKLESSLANGVGLTTGEMRQLLDTTRKYAIPILEYFDRMGITVRDGDLRMLAKRI